jgi:hypothetical protein
VAVPPDGEVKVKASLQRKGAGPSWYQHWYVLAAASALVVGAGGTTVYFATRNNNPGPADNGKLTFTGGIQ